VAYEGRSRIPSTGIWIIRCWPFLTHDSTCPENIPEKGKSGC
jgi:hypothetical protein